VRGGEFYISVVKKRRIIIDLGRKKWGRVDRRVGKNLGGADSELQPLEERKGSPFGEAGEWGGPPRRRKERNRPAFLPPGRKKGKRLSPVGRLAARHAPV